MIVNVDVHNRKIEIDDKLAELYLKYVGGLDDNSVNFIFITEGIDITKHTDDELPELLETILRKELRIKEQLSRPETLKAAIAFANRK